MKSNDKNRVSKSPLPSIFKINDKGQENQSKVEILQNILLNPHLETSFENTAANLLHLYYPFSASALENPNKNLLKDYLR